MIPLSLITREEKSEAVETCRIYETAPVEVCQERTGIVLTSREPLAGENNKGICGTAPVVNLHTEDHGLAPEELEALTRQ